MTRILMGGEWDDKATSARHPRQTPPLAFRILEWVLDTWKRDVPRSGLPFQLLFLVLGTWSGDWPSVTLQMMQMAEQDSLVGVDSPLSARGDLVGPWRRWAIGSGVLQIKPS